MRPWSVAEKRLVPLVAAVVVAWVLVPLLSHLLPDDALTDGTVAILGALLLFVIPDGTGRAILNWEEANRATWGVIMMFGGGLALAAGITASGLATRSEERRVGKEGVSTGRSRGVP